LLNAYAFEVNTKANKVEIKKAVEAAYGVSVAKVRTINVRPDRSTKFTKTGIQHGKTNAVKKAIVQLAEGETIDLYANM
jgi:large subunit ribosomal protein L23